jgi:hypothetical protein
MLLTSRLNHKHTVVHEDFIKSRKDFSEYTDAMKVYREFLSKHTCSSEPHLHAFLIYRDPIQKEVVESLLLADADPKDIMEVFGIPAEVILIYGELFFDTTAFRAKLDKVSYIEQYPERFGKDLKLRAFALGPEFVYWTYGNVIPKTDSQRALVKRMFMTSAYRAMEATFNGIDSKITKQALDWSKNMLKAYEALEKLLSQEGSTDYSLTKYILEFKVAEPVEGAEPIPEEDIV